jgi:molecular chaperone DnaJ
MNRDKQDYYELLGVARDADRNAIKQAFRARARTLHPDVSSEPDAKDRFAELSRAYSILSKPEARILYDRYGYLGTGNGGFDPTLPGASDPASAEARHVDFAEVQIRLFETIRGSTRRVQVATVGLCESCGGSGAAPEASVLECAACGGEGRLRTSSELGEGRLLQIETCLACAGRGVVVERPCRRCHGLGRARDERTVKLEIPPGAEDGGVIRVVDANEDGGAGSTARALYVRLRVVPESESRLLRTIAAAALVIAVVLFTILYLAPEAIFDAL